VLHALTAALLEDDTVSGALLREMLPVHDFHADAANDAAALRVAMETASAPA